MCTGSRRSRAISWHCQTHHTSQSVVASSRTEQGRTPPFPKGAVRIRCAAAANHAGAGAACAFCASACGSRVKLVMLYNHMGSLTTSAHNIYPGFLNRSMFKPRRGAHSVLGDARQPAAYNMLHAMQCSPNYRHGMARGRVAACSSAQTGVNCILFAWIHLKCTALGKASPTTMAHTHTQSKPPKPHNPHTLNPLPPPPHTQSNTGGHEMM